MSAEHPDYVTITHGMRGHYPVLMGWDEEFEAYMPWESHPCSYPTADAAVPMAREWAEAEGVELHI